VDHCKTNLTKPPNPNLKICVNIRCDLNVLITSNLHFLTSEPTYKFEDRQCSGQGTEQVDNDQQNASQITKDRVA
jgi:hypothetical protein